MNTAMENALPTILSALAGAGVGITAVLAARGHKRACDKMAKHEIPENMPTREVFKEAASLTWKDYAPAVGAGVVTVGLIFASNGMHLKKEAALMALVGVIGARLKGMDMEVLKKYGKEALDTMRNDILNREVNDRADKLAETNKKKHESDEGVYYEPFTEQFFWATANDIKNAELHLNQMFQQNGSVTLADFIQMLPKKDRLDIPDWADQMGWYSGDENFEWNAAFSSGYISLNPTQTTVNGWQADVLQYSIYPAEPGEDYIDIVRGDKIPYSFYSPEPGDQLDMRQIDFGLPVQTKEPVAIPA